jgi:hypothetical protein
VVGIYQNQIVDLGIEQPTPYLGTTFLAATGSVLASSPSTTPRPRRREGGEFRAGVTIPLWRNQEHDRRRASLAQAEPCN